MEEKVKKGVAVAVLDELNKLDDVKEIQFIKEGSSDRFSQVSDNIGSAAKIEEEVIIRPVVREKTTRTNDEIFINAEDDDPKIGDLVYMGDNLAEDGVYEYTDRDGEEMLAEVRDGAISDLMKKVIRAGKMQMKKVRTVKKRVSPKVLAALRKARAKAHTGKAKMARKKSMKVRKQKIAASVEAPAGSAVKDSVDVNYASIDMEKLGDALLIAVFEKLTDTYSLTDEQVEALTDKFDEDICTPVLDGSTLKVKIPVWTELKDEIDLEDFDTQDFEIELEGEMTNDSLLKKLTEGEDSLLDSIII